MKKLILAGFILTLTTGCSALQYAYTPAKYVGEKICSKDTTEAQRQVLKEKWEEEMGHIWSAPRCTVPAKDSVEVTGDVE